MMDIENMGGGMGGTDLSFVRLPSMRQQRFTLLSTPDHPD